MRYPLYGIAVLLVIGCGESPISESAPPSAVTGTWSLSTHELGNSCASDGQLSPLAPGAVEIDMQGDRMSLRDSSGVRQEFHRAGDTWLRRDSFEIDGCRLELDTRWQIAGLAHTRLSALFTAEMVTTGACAPLELSTCRVRTAVSGVRQR